MQGRKRNMIMSFLLSLVVIVSGFSGVAASASSTIHTDDSPASVTVYCVNVYGDDLQHAIKAADKNSVITLDVDTDADSDITETTEYTLTINYVYYDGTTAAQSYTISLAEGESYSVASPLIDDYAASEEVVSGMMSAEDTIINVTYTETAIVEEEPAVDNVTTWSLVSLVEVIGTIAIAAFTVISGIKNKKVNVALAVAGVALAVGAVVLFALTSNMGNAMTAVDKWTIGQTLIITSQGVVTYFVKKQRV